MCIQHKKINSCNKQSTISIIYLISKRNEFLIYICTTTTTTTTTLLVI